MEEKYDKILETLDQIDSRINELLKEKIFITREFSLNRDDYTPFLSGKTDEEKNRLEEMLKQAQTLIKDEKQNEKKLAILGTELFVLFNGNEKIYERYQKQIEDLSEEDKKTFEELNEKREKLLEELIKVTKEIENAEKTKENDLNPDKDTEEKEIFKTISSLKNSIENRNLEKITKCSIDLIQYMKTLKNASDVKKINDKLSTVLSTINTSPKQLKDFNEEEIKDLLGKVQEVEKVIQEIEKNKDNEKKDPEPPKKEEDKIRERMAEILYKDPKKAYNGIENENEKDPERRLTEKEIEEFGELRDKLNKLLGRMTVIPPKPKKKKGRLVKYFKKAKDFYKKHKKAILLIGGIVLFAVAMQALLPSIMYFNSVMWNQAVLSGASGLPTVLHDINLIIGSKIGASYAASSGIWTLANGAVLNATAAQAGILASLGKIALSVGGMGIGATVAIKNAYNLAKEKIQKRKAKKVNNTKPAKDKSFFDELKESFTKGYRKGKSKSDSKANPPKKGSPENEIPKENTAPTNDGVFHNDNVSDRVNGVINYYIVQGHISKEDAKKLEKLPKEECIAKFKEIIANIAQNEEKKNNDTPSKSPSFYKEGVLPEVINYINYCIQRGVYIQEDIDLINSSEAELINKNISRDPKYYEYLKMINNTPVEEEKKEGRGSK